MQHAVSVCLLVMDIPHDLFPLSLIVKLAAGQYCPERASNCRIDLHAGLLYLLRVCVCVCVCVCVLCICTCVVCVLDGKGSRVVAQR